MKQFKVYENPLGNYEAVKQGWSWVAFFFTAIWAMIAKMWGLGIGILVGMFILGMIIGASGTIFQGGEALINIVGIVVGMVFGINGNKWRESSLSGRGYELKDTVTAANKEGAIALYVKESNNT